MASKGKSKAVSDDELLDQLINEKKHCHHTTCNKSIAVVKITCHLCKENFCTTHMLPEVHGCGGAAKKDAAAPPKPKPIKEEKAAQLENKLSKKLQQMKNERKKKTK